ncbi:hypothetical protein BOTNAR_0402g00100 [Botryotinia narcissicola]|uniref:Uncharacterized protein n=1 Tax=Botryotinia narcissicola TaxID=278944 RepID=A0A4Z1HNE6_9HELO|nr:hypothetical protein BOTNAR_0402g00100 [Botryotinia narcissicola]
MFAVARELVWGGGGLVLGCNEFRDRPSVSSVCETSGSCKLTRMRFTRAAVLLLAANRDFGNPDENWDKELCDIIRDEIYVLDIDDDGEADEYSERVMCWFDVKSVVSLLHLLSCVNSGEWQRGRYDRRGEKYPVRSALLAILGMMAICRSELEGECGEYVQRRDE